MTLTIRHLSEADLEPLERVLVAAFGIQSNYKKEIQRYKALQRDGWFVAELDGAPVGMVGAVDYGEFAYVGLMVVHPTVQRRGIGRALMERLLDWLDGRGVPVVLLDATEAGASLYTKLGFVDDSSTLVFQGEHGASSPYSSLKVSTLRKEELSALTAFDAPIFGANRLCVFATYLSEFSDRAFAAHTEAGQIAGYLVAQHSILGPWAASTPEVAEALLAVALKEPFDGAPRVLVPSTNQAATSLLERQGFIKQRTLRHMRRGGSAALGQRERLYGLVSLAIG